MNRKYLGLFIFITLSLTAQGQSATSVPGNGTFAWWRAVDVDEGLSKEETFNAYLGDLVSVAKVGYKALPPEALDPRNKEKVEAMSPYYLEQGDIISTTNPTDLAVKGQGFFKVSDDSGTIFYTREGNFYPDNEGVLRNEEQLKLEPPLTLTDTQRLMIDDNSTLWRTSLGGDAQQLYQFELWLPAEGAQVSREGVHFIFSEVTPASLNRTNRVILQSLELSTTQAAKTLAQMTEVLYNLKAEDSTEQNLEFRLYMVDFLLKEYMKAQGSIKDLERFGKLTESIAGNVSFENGQEANPSAPTKSTAPQPQAGNAGRQTSTTEPALYPIRPSS